MEQSVTLLKTEEARLDQLYYSKGDENQLMNFTQFMLFVLERSLINNKFCIEVFYQAFKEAAKDSEYLDIKGFTYAIVYLSQTIFSEETNPVETMFTTLLMDKTLTYSNDLAGGRIPKTDSETLAVISEDAILFYIAYIEKFKALFSAYHHYNQLEKKRPINWKEIGDKNFGILAGSFLNFGKDYFLIPHMFNVEVLEGILFSIIPPLHKEEYDYFSQHQLVLQYEGDKSKISSNYQLIDGEPQLLFHEFLFVLGKIANTTVVASEAHTLEEKLTVFLHEKLRFPIIENPKEYAMKVLNNEIEPENELYSSDEDLEEDYEDDPHQTLLDFIERRAKKDENYVLDYEKVLQELEMILPPVPEEPKGEQINPPPYAMPRELFGRRLPRPEEDDKNKKKKQMPKRRPERRKKDEKPKKIYPFAQYPPPPPEPRNIDHFNQLKDEMTSSVFPKHYNASQGNPGVGPGIIKEVLFPPEAPQEFATLIESALVYQNIANYEMAIATFEDGREDWRNQENGGKPLRPEIELYFELSLGSVYESAGRDELALSKYLKAKDIKLVYNHPDQAFPYGGLGSILFHMEEPVWALRSYLKAREIREERLGGDTIDTATVYNNLGGGMLTMERNQEAFAFFELSEAIFEVELGPQHERTLTASRNISKSRFSFVNIISEEVRPEGQTGVPSIMEFRSNKPESKADKEEGKEAEEGKEEEKIKNKITQFAPP